MQHETRPVGWTSAEQYEPYVGRWSRRVAAEFVPWLEVDDGAHWIETGCGTGALTATIVDRARPVRLLATDPSLAFLEYARSVASASSVDVREGRAESIDAPDASADATVSGLVLNFVADPVAALAEARRVTRPGGVVAAYVWDYAGEMWAMRHFWDTAMLLDPVARRLHEGRRFASWQPDELARRFEDAGLVDVEVRSIVIETPFRDADDYWRPLLGGQGPAPTYVASLQPGAVEALRRAVLRSLPIAADGSIHLTARAWAVRGTAP